MDWMLMPLRRYADFQGRSRRKEYWLFALGVTIVFLLLGVVAGIAGAATGSAEGVGALGGIGVILIGIAGLAIIVPSIAVQIRRFHDQDRSGWFVLLNLIPYLGGLIVLVMMCIEGTRGPNRFGPDPKAGM